MKRAAPLGWRARLVGPAVTLGAMAVLRLLAAVGLPVSHPVPFLDLTLVYGAYEGGTASGLACALLMLGYTVLHFSPAGHIFAFDSEHWHRLMTQMLVSPAIVLLIGRLKARHDARLGQLRQAEQLLEAFLDQTPASVCLRDMEGRYLFVNRAYEQGTGRSRAEFQGRTHFDVLKPQVAELIEAKLQRVRREGDLLSLEETFPDSDVVFLTNTFLVRDEDGVPFAIGNISTSITELKRAERRARAYARELADRNVELDRFAAAASHDLQEPLRKLQIFSTRLLHQHAAALPPEARDLLERLHGGARRLSALVEDMLAFARLGSEALRLGKVSLGDVLAAAWGDLQESPDAVGARLHAEALPTVEGDASLLHRVMLNLLGNSLRYRRPDAPPEIRVSASVADGICELRIEDNGIGFDPAYQERIFEPFYRLHARGTYEGTGVGLSTCRRILERLHGRIRAEGRPGEGATFVVILPLKQPETSGSAAAYGRDLES